MHGPGDDEPLVWYEGTAIADRRWLMADQLGSIIAIANDAGTSTGTNTYDEYGQPGLSNTGRFQYTGQMWLPEVELYHYKARTYSPELGRFLQTDPIGYGDGMNMYAYVHNDPVNAADPEGLSIYPNWRKRPGDDDLPSGLPKKPYEPLILGGDTVSTLVINGEKKKENRSGSSGGVDPSQFVGDASDRIERILEWLYSTGPHSYGFGMPMCDGCSPGDAFEAWRYFSAPGAPYAKEGTHDVTIAGGNPIRQTVDEDAMTIVNETRPGHVFGGQVTISIVVSNGLVSVQIVGSGVGPNAGWNQVFGPGVFRGLALGAYLSMNPGDINTGP